MPTTEPQSLIPIRVERNASKLYVVGNGFDLWHAIASSYGGFRSFVKARDRKLFQTIEDYPPAGDDWADLEVALASIDIDSIVDDLGHFMASYGSDDWSDAGHHDFQCEVDGVVERLRVARGRYAARVLTADSPNPFPQMRPAAHAGRRSATDFAVLGCAMAHRPPMLAGRSPETTAAHRQAVHHAQSHPRRNLSSPRQCARSVHPW